MVQPSVALTALVSWFRGIPALVAQMGGNPLSISGHFFAYGDENSLSKVVGEMQPPAILVAYKAIIGGQFDGSSIFRHQFEIYLKSTNLATNGGVLPGNVTSLSTPDLWWLMINSPSTASFDAGQNILQGVLLQTGSLPFLLPPDQPPSLLPRHDAMGDFFVGSITFPELYT